jgi:hypothetical protein
VAPPAACELPWMHIRWMHFVVLVQASTRSQETPEWILRPDNLRR